MLKGLFFDLDGTLINTTQSNFLAYKSALLEINTNLKFEDYSAVEGEDSRVFLKKIFPNLSSEQIIQVRTRKSQLYKNFLSYTEVNSTFLQMLKKNHHLIRGLVTNAKKQNVTEILNYHQLEHLFSFIVTGDDVSDGKPNPEIYERALEISQLTNNEVVTFEDSFAGITAAKAAGISCCVV